MIKRSCVIIVDDNKILLMHRIKKGEEYYTTIGGGIEPGETAKEAAIRETKEETNLDVKLDGIFCELEDKVGYGIYYITKSFSGEEKLSGPEAKRSNKDNYYELKWIKKENLKDINLVPKEIKERIIEYFARK